MRKLLIFVLLACTFPVYAGYGWYKQNSQTFNDLNGVYMFSSSKAITVGLNGTIRTTTNGGLNWSIYFTGTSSSLHKVGFADNLKGTIIGAGGLILNTVDGGNSWTQLLQGLSQNLNAITFVKNGGVSTNTGYIVGSGGKILKTTDGGTTWSSLTSGTSEILIDVNFINNNTGYVVGYNGTIIKTTDAGLTWVSKTAGNSSAQHYGVNFIDANTGVVCGGNSSFTNGYILKTTNGGNSWFNSFGIYTPSAIHIPYYHNTNVISVVGNNGIILRSYDAGSTWTIQSNQSTDFIYDVDFSDINTGIAVGKNGSIVSTVTGGLTTVTPVSSNVPDKFSLNQNYPNPFNPSTTITFNIKNATFASLKVFDMTGKEVKSLVNENIAAGSYEISFNAAELNSGVYFYTLKTNEFTETKKMMLVK